MTVNIVERSEETREEIRNAKKKLKELAATQKEEKNLLHMPHYEIPAIPIKLYSGSTFQCGGINRAGRLMDRTRNRAYEITQLHIKYNKMRGKPYDMYEYKERHNG